MSRYLPVGLDIRDQPCLVVGGGGVGTRKALALSRAGAAITVVSPTLTGELAAHADAGRIRWVEDTFRPEHLGGVFLVIAATDDEALNADIVDRAGRGGALVCDASSAERSKIIFGALHEAGELTVAVFTDGRDPARAAETRDRIASILTEPNGERS
ncbi:MAG: precorrin-2 dehydrogenase/sirohydrochlorin ferrochelatase family protein [Planctomycetota bacterium]|jgi:siroheme synthase-like protein